MESRDAALTPEGACVGLSDEKISNKNPDFYYSV